MLSLPETYVPSGGEPIVSTTPTLDRLPVQPPETSTTARRYKVWIWVLAVITVLAAAIAVGYATGLIGEDDPEADAPATDEPADEQPPDDQPADDQPADDQPADDQPADAPRPPPIRYDEELRANWDVTGVTADDVLNVRNAPGVDAPIIATLEHDTAELESTGRIAYVGDQLWREIIVPGDSAGWVSAAYLTETR